MGFTALRLCDRLLPEAAFKPLRAAGTAIAVLSMPVQRRHSRAYLRAALGREPGLGDVFGHFFAVCEALVRRLRVADGKAHRCVFGPGCEDFRAWLKSGRPAFLGTFHIADSDLTGYLLAGQGKRRIHMVRERVGNSLDTEAMASRLGGLLNFVWVNDPAEMLFALKEAALGSDTIALQCDRPEHSSRSASFQFLGAERRLPVTIYHLALIFGRPVILSFGAPSLPGESTLYASPAFEPVAGEAREDALSRAHRHFQDFLKRVEEYLRVHPYQWLNFLPL